MLLILFLNLEIFFNKIHFKLKKLFIKNPSKSKIKKFKILSMEEQ